MACILRDMGATVSPPDFRGLCPLAMARPRCVLSPDGTGPAPGTSPAQAHLAGWVPTADAPPHSPLLQKPSLSLGTRMWVTLRP